VYFGRVDNNNLGGYSDKGGVVMEFVKPPLGIIPRKIHDRNREISIGAAICRYLLSRKPIKLEWVEEYNELVNKRQ